MKIYLIGYMGSGKSTIGRLLASQMNLDFIDFDKYIEDATGKSIAEIFDISGESKFRELEHEHLKTLVTKNNAVISLGGGTPCFHNNIDLINKSGTSIYLDVDLDTLVKRLSKEKNNRPLIKDLNGTKLKSFIQTNLEKRKSTYEKAHVAILTSSLSAKEVSKEIRKRIIKYKL